MKERTAILIFSRSAEAECHFKSFNGNLHFFQSQEKRLKSLCNKTNLDTFIFDENLQKGNTFGERFSNAVSETFSKGYSNLIIIGNDSPQLKFQHLQSSIKALQKNKASLGKTLDGGFYLLAIQKEHYNPSKFLNLPWNSSKLSSELIQLLEDKIEIDFLPVLKDVDSQTDFSNLLNFTKQLYADVILILKSIHKLFSFNFKNPSLLVEDVRFNSYQNKAPPLLLNLD